MRELPDIPDILSTVRDFLLRLGRTLEKGPRFEAQVAVYLLDIARRELEAAAKANDRPADNEATKLCQEIRFGAHDACWDQTLQKELNAAIARVLVVRPDYIE